jgi:hypothetical protein
MSLALSLGIERWGRSDGTPILAYNRLVFEAINMEDLKDKIKPFAVPLPEGVEWYDDDGLETHTDDAYGEPLTYIAAHHLAPLLNGHLEHTRDPFCFAVAAFVGNLPPDRKIVLYWN